MALLCSGHASDDRFLSLLDPASEVGYAHGKGKPVIVIAEDKKQVPLMAGGMIDKLLVVGRLDRLDDYVGRLATSLKRF